MTAIRDRRSDPDAAEDDATPFTWDERPMFGPWRGLPWWGAVLCAFGLAAVGALVDLQVSDALGLLFQGCYLVGSIGAIIAVRRRNLFGPMVQPPLILAITVPAVVLAGSGLPASSDALAKVLAISTPLINGFPTMAITTGATVAIGLYRMFRERDPDAPRNVPAKNKQRPSKPHDGDAAGRDKEGRDRPGKQAKGTPARGRPQEGRAPGRGKPEGRGKTEGSAAASGKSATGRPASGKPAEGPRRGAQGATGAAASGRRGRPDEAPRGGGERSPERGSEPRKAGGRGARQPGSPPPGDKPTRGRPRNDDRPDAARRPSRPRQSPPRSGEQPPDGAEPPPRRPDQGGRPPRRSRPWDDDRR